MAWGEAHSIFVPKHDFFLPDCHRIDILTCICKPLAVTYEPQSVSFSTNAISIIAINILLFYDK